MTREEEAYWDEYAEWLNNHSCIIQETPDGLACPICLYC